MSQSYDLNPGVFTFTVWFIYAGMDTEKVNTVVFEHQRDGLGPVLREL